ncbi:hypothetical protein PIB30_053805 [Stylosanthes scabra]|uniref:Dormancy-associated protein homolog 4 n=1 Tax=Stylosanthes scabra TaxID=79078 RepID=A0ABU6ZHC7_9FABA|nr:hypothetical protein [Stylosanthes scabra]
MGFLHKLWDETLAGPAPESGLGKLRKYNSFGSGRSPMMSHDVPISRSIIIVRDPSALRPATNDPASPSLPLTPQTPTTPDTPGVDFKKFTRKKTSAIAAVDSSTSTRPNNNDWV